MNESTNVSLRSIGKNIKELVRTLQNENQTATPAPLKKGNVAKSVKRKKKIIDESAMVDNTIENDVTSNTTKNETYEDLQLTTIDSSVNKTKRKKFTLTQKNKLSPDANIVLSLSNPDVTREEVDMTYRNLELDETRIRTRKRKFTLNKRKLDTQVPISLSQPLQKISHDMSNNDSNEINLSDTSIRPKRKRFTLAYQKQAPSIPVSLSQPLPEIEHDETDATYDDLDGLDENDDVIPKKKTHLLLKKPSHFQELPSFSFHEENENHQSEQDMPMNVSTYASPLVKNDKSASLYEQLMEAKELHATGEVVHSDHGSPAHFEPKSSIHSKPESQVPSDPKSLVSSDPESPVPSDPESPVHSDPGSPVHSDPESPVPSDPGSPVHSDPGSPVHSDPGNPVHSDPGNPVHSDPGYQPSDTPTEVFSQSDEDISVKKTTSQYENISIEYPTMKRTEKEMQESIHGIDPSSGVNKNQDMMENEGAIDYSQIEQEYSQQSVAGTTEQKMGTSKTLRQSKLDEFLQRLCKNPPEKPEPSTSSSLFELCRKVETSEVVKKHKTKKIQKSSAKDQTNISLPLSYTKKTFNHFLKHRPHKDSAEAVREFSKSFFDNLSSDLSVIASSKNVTFITANNMYVLMKQLGFVSCWQELYQLIREYLPAEYYDSIIPTRYAHNKILPVKKKR